MEVKPDNFKPGTLPTNLVKDKEVTSTIIKAIHPKLKEESKKIATRNNTTHKLIVKKDLVKVKFIPKYVTFRHPIEVVEESDDELEPNEGVITID